MQIKIGARLMLANFLILGVSLAVFGVLLQQEVDPGILMLFCLLTAVAVKRADDALYWVKNNGRNGIMAWHELTHDYRDQRLELTKPASTTCPCRRIPAPPCAVSSDIDAA